MPSKKKEHRKLYNVFCKYKTNNTSHSIFRTAVHLAELLLMDKTGILRLNNVWGVGGGAQPVKSLTRSIHMLLKEYLSSKDSTEAGRCLRELEVPHFHHELVYEVSF